MISRRSFLVTGAAVGVSAVGGAFWGVQERVLPGRERINHLLGLDGPAGVIPDVTAGFTVSGTLDSAAVRGPVGWQIAYPGPTAEPLPVVVALHGLNADHRWAFSSLGVDRFLTDHVVRGGRPFAVASVDGGQSSYWHARSDGTDHGAMVIDEFLPLLAAQGLSTSRVGLLG